MGLEIWVFMDICRVYGPKTSENVPRWYFSVLGGFGGSLGGLGGGSGTLAGANQAQKMVKKSKKIDFFTFFRGSNVYFCAIDFL